MNVMDIKREVSILIPYKLKAGKALVYLRRRAKDAKRSPDNYGFFGGGKEMAETPEETLMREIREELDFTPITYSLFNDYEFERLIMHAFILKVDDGFVKEIKILEGQYGKYFSEDDILHESKLSDHDKIVLGDLYKFLRLRK